MPREKKEKLNPNDPEKSMLKMLFKEILEQIVPEDARRLTDNYLKGRTIGFRIMENSAGRGNKTAFHPFAEGKYVCSDCKEGGQYIAFDTLPDYETHVKVHERIPVSTSGGNLIDRIKEYREKHNCSLKEAYEAVNYGVDATNCPVCGTELTVGGRGAKWCGKCTQRTMQDQMRAEAPAPSTCGTCGRPWVDGKCSGGFVNHTADGTRGYDA
jgi:hypothetical protein